jgi:UDP-N-acetylglucosamine 2-epimerase (non-hydrolysing)
MQIINVVGARPNFMKIAPIIEEMKKTRSIKQTLVHTGQHYDEKMSKLFFDELELPKPDINLEVGSGTHAFQTAEIMKRFEPILLEHKPDYINVVGDVNSTIACSLTASKLGVKIIHVEAGLRSSDRTMPEEINRVLTDAISDILFTTEKSGNENLIKEGIPKEKIFFVGNVMIDTLMKHREKASRSNILSQMGVSEKSYCLVTLHRPSNVDNKATLEDLLSTFKEVSKKTPVIFSVHPRTRERIGRFGLLNYINDKSHGKVSEGINLCNPLGYIDFLKLTDNARLVLLIK